jgi:cytochrome c peroxidase
MRYIFLLFTIVISPTSFADDHSNAPRSRIIGAGDSKIGYETKDYKTDSIAIEARKGTPTDLMKVLKKPPLGLPPVPVPTDYPITNEKVQLGKKLFFDRRLSINNTMACAMCHIPEQGFTSHELEKAVGVEGRSMRRNSPTIYNVAYLTKLFHDGREVTLEDQIWGPLLSKNEMAMTSVGHVLKKVNSLSDYDGEFEKAFGEDEANLHNIGQALASYQRTLVSANSPFDRWYYGKEEKAISAKAKNGFKHFMGKAHCVGCHSVTEEYALFTDNALHNTGIGYERSMGKEPEAIQMPIAPGIFATVTKAHMDELGFEGPMEDIGFYEVTQDPDDRWKYRTPTLRNVALTGPYMHDGSIHTLREVIEFYRKGGVPNVTQSPMIRPLDLTDEEVDELVAFLETLNGDNVAELISDAFSTPVGDTMN